MAASVAKTPVPAGEAPAPFSGAAPGRGPFA